MTRKINARSELAALLDALEQEVLAADAGEVRDALRQTGRSCDVACQEIRSLLSDAVAASDEGFPVTPERAVGGRIGQYRH